MFRPFTGSLSGLLAVCAVATVLLSGCGQTASAGEGTLRIPITGSLRIPDPATTANTRSLFLDSLLYSGLLRFGPDLHVIPDLAVAIPTIAHGGRVYIFTIRRGVRFADGRRVLAVDVARSFARALGPGLHSDAARRMLGGIAGARAVEQGSAGALSGITVLSRLSLEIRLARPDPDFLSKLAFPPADVVERRNRDLVGSGPWRVQTRSSREIDLVPSRYQYQGDMDLVRLILERASGIREALQMYRRGDVDVAEVPFSRYNALSTRPSFFSSNGLRAYYLVARGMPVRGFSTEINATALTNGEKGLAALTSIVPPAVPDYVPSVPGAAGTSGKPAVSVVVSQSDAVAELLRRRLQHQVADGPSPYTLVSASHLLPDPRVWLDSVPRSATTPWFRYTLGRANEIVEDPVTRMSLYSADENWALRRGLVVPLASQNRAYLIRPAVQGLSVTPYGLMPNDGAWASVSRE